MPATIISFPPLRSPTERPNQVQVQVQNQNRKAFKEQRRYLVYFITGNPGLIGYYKAYLATLHDILETKQGLGGGGIDGKSNGDANGDAKDNNDEKKNHQKNDKKGKVEFHVYGRSLGGFVVGGRDEGEKECVDDVEIYKNEDKNAQKEYDVSSQKSTRGTKRDWSVNGSKVYDRRARNRENTKLYSLQEQIDFVKDDLLGVVALERERERERGWESCDTQEQKNGYVESDSRQQPVQVILVGHSVGAYIAMMILSWWRISLDHRHNATCPADDSVDEMIKAAIGNDSLRPEEKTNPENIDTLHIAGVICLFPTIEHIAKSKSGRIFTPLSQIPFFAQIVAVIAYLLFSWQPLFMLARLVQLLTRMPAEAAKITASFLQSRGGVRQALHMAKHEMRTITGDKWDAGIWGSRAMPPSYTNTPPRAKLYFFFGEDDHWVADETRDGLIQRYGRAMNHGFEEEKDNEKEKDRWRSVMEIDQSGISHGFCLRHSDAVAKKTAMYIWDIVNTEQI